MYWLSLPIINCVHIFKLSCLNINPEEYSFFLSILVGTNKKLSNLGDFLDMMMTVEWLRQIVAIEKEEGSNRRETTLLICPPFRREATLYDVPHVYLPVLWDCMFHVISVIFSAIVVVYLLINIVYKILLKYCCIYLTIKSVIMKSKILYRNLMQDVS